MACDLFSIFRIESLEGEEARERFGHIDSDGCRLLLVDEQGECAGSEALDRIARRLGGLWRWIAVALPSGPLERAFGMAARLSSDPAVRGGSGR